MAAVLRFNETTMWAVAEATDAALSRPTASSETGRLRDRQPDAWRTFFEREMPAIYSYAYSRTGRPAEAEDLAAQVFEHAWRAAPSLEDRGLPARAWLFGIARNVVNEHRRGLFRRPPALALEAFDGGDSGMEKALDQITLARAVAALPKLDGEVITLRFLHGLALQETSDALGLTVDAVKARQARALRQLRGSLAPVRHSSNPQSREGSTSA